MLKDLRDAVLDANLELNRRGVVLYTWGNVSAIDRDSGLIVIKPSGVAYDAMTADDMVVVSLDNEVVWGSNKPSSDTRTHTALYRAFPEIGGVAHTHSTHAVAWAQARRAIPCLGTTQADYCAGEVPCTAPLPPDEVQRDYETATGDAIIRRFQGLDPVAVPMVLVAGHGPFTWGKDADDAVHNAVVLEESAKMATLTVTVSGPNPQPLEDYVLDYHYQRKHGKNAWYGQN
ncbi:L-ribulose-5-phosphate 4-epimerase [Tropicimonas isoalkanivorans]|uniref:L-ribulose-5-phosphate 4-epimerase n=1 Tax=Tropicimonas isoalkanivorans TaxID=441112 RepID=A0A1I1DHF9_9RHOB|nr:L-ribulose-5-phosphate 4-epimerase [Tropicimonas isoalkanivorans]SFB73812.1 L-ribulose-5-phosphate 4-epimerase [Tropicimonas isoalkanivorans]